MRSFLILLFAFTSIAVCAQEDQAEIRTFGGDQSEYGRDIIECANGDVMMLGMTTSDAANQSQAYIIRVDQDLNCIWSKSVGLFGVESPEKIIEMKQKLQCASPKIQERCPAWLLDIREIAAPMPLLLLPRRAI